MWVNVEKWNVLYSCKKIQLRKHKIASLSIARKRHYPIHSMTVDYC